MNAKVFTKGEKKGFKIVLIGSIVVFCLSFILCIALFMLGVDEKGLQWLILALVIGFSTGLFSSLMLLSNYIRERRQNKYKEKFDTNIKFWLNKEYFGYKKDFSDRLFNNDSKFPIGKKSRIEKLEYVRNRIKKEYSYKELKIWKLYFEMKKDDISSITLILSFVFSFGLISFYLGFVPDIYNIAFILNNSSIIFAFIYCGLYVIFPLGMLLTFWETRYSDEKNYRLYYPIICSILNDYETKRKNSKK